MGLITDMDRGLLNSSSLEEARKGKVIYLDLDEIKPNPNNIWDVDDSEIQMKAENILEVGLLQPLLVLKKDGETLLNTGHKRYFAIKKITEEGKSYRYLGKDLNGAIPCQYLNDIADENQFDLVAICSNAHHPDSKSEKREKVWRMHQYYQELIQRGKKPDGREREWITAMTGISDGTVKTLLTQFNAVTEEEMAVLPEETKTDVNKEVTKKLKRMNRYLSNVDLASLSGMERRILNELLRSVQETLEELIYVDQPVTE